jgi:AcrR family transcriptional regulator
MEMSLKSVNKRTSVALALDVEAKPEGKPRTRVLRKVITASVAKKPLAEVAAPEKKSATVIPSGVRRVRSNRRSEQTIANILAATENSVLESGAERISILDVCRAADVSRGTFYRYFASQDELLDAFSRHKRERFHVALAEAVESYDDPDERFEALIRYLNHYLEHGRARRLLVVAPEYAFGFFRRIFHDSVVRFQDVLAMVFDAWEARLGVKLDRELVCEMMIRYVLSELLVPGDTERKTVPRRIARMVESLTSGGSPRARR